MADSRVVRHGSIPDVRAAALLGLSLCLAPDARAQAIRVAPPAVIAREAGPRRFSEPHLGRDSQES
jgi:hypothetical protein